MRATVVDWLALAEQRLAKSGVECYNHPAMTMSWKSTKPLAPAAMSRIQKGNTFMVKGEYEMIASVLQPHPVDSPREKDEEALLASIQGMAEKLANPHKAIFNFHCPPFDSGLDTAPKIDKTSSGHRHHRYGDERRGLDRRGTGNPGIPAAARLHGHVHESRQRSRSGKLCVSTRAASTARASNAAACYGWTMARWRDYMLTSG